MIDHVLGDWGSTRLRLWLVRDGAIADRCEGPGIVGLARPPSEVLGEALAAWRREAGLARITLCGMAGARAGLHEAHYAECPVDLAGWAARAASVNADGITTYIGAGCAAPGTQGRPDDVMRGEETQVFGALELNPALAIGRHTIALPGTHSKWVTVDNGKIVGLRTFPTGELFASLLASSLVGSPSSPEDGGGFAAGLERARISPGFLGTLFEARTQQLRHGRTARWARGFLSGLLIGTEIAEMATTQGLPGVVTIVGDPMLAKLYFRALASRDSVGEIKDGEDCVLAGLRMLDAHCAAAAGRIT